MNIPDGTQLIQRGQITAGDWVYMPCSGWSRIESPHPFEGMNVSTIHAVARSKALVSKENLK